MRIIVKSTQQGRPEFWPRQLVRKWLNLRHGGNQKFNRDIEMDAENEYEVEGFGALEKKTGSDMKDIDVHADIDLSAVADTPPKYPLSLLRGQSETLRQQFVDDHEFRVSVQTWNVAGNPPPADLDLENWIDASEPADIYVFGFQEIVPLSANNVFCVEDKGPAAMWESKIRDTLNNKMGKQKDNDPYRSYSAPASPRRDDITDQVSEVSDVEKLLERCVSGKNLETAFLASEGNFLNYEKNLPNQGENVHFQDGWSLARSSSEPILDDVMWPLTKQASEVNTERLHQAAVADELCSEASNLLGPLFSTNDRAAYSSLDTGHHYSRVASKQMVGLFITVWVRSNLWRHVHNVKVSTVGCGLMRYLGNKGSISVSMSLHHTTFCFVCAHLTSGHNKGDELRRNGDVAEILRRSRFPRLVKMFGLELPETILEHDRVIWFGDLNYRLALPDKEIWKLANRGDWEALLPKDQLKLEQSEGRVFEDWHEGQIFFSPTYKFVEESDQYAGETTSTGEKRRSPAWCDRVLWHGKGLKQVGYTRGDSKLSDHRSVSATFMAKVEVVSHRKLKKACVYPKNVNVDVKTKVYPRLTPTVDTPTNFCCGLLKHLVPRLRKWLCMSESIKNPDYIASSHEQAALYIQSQQYQALLPTQRENTETLKAEGLTQGPLLSVMYSPFAERHGDKCKIAFLIEVCASARKLLTSTIGSELLNLVNWIQMVTAPWEELKTPFGYRPFNIGRYYRRSYEECTYRRLLD